jgi:hypothetical protein
VRLEVLDVVVIAMIMTTTAEGAASESSQGAERATSAGKSGIHRDNAERQHRGFWPALPLSAKSLSQLFYHPRIAGVGQCPRSNRFAL